MIYKHIVVLESLMLHAKFPEIGSPAPERKTFEGFLAYMGMGAILVKRPELFINKLVPPLYRNFLSNLALTC